MSLKKMFVTDDGRNHALTFILVCSLFCLWGVCNGMIDVLNKHFQNSLGVSKAQSAFVQGAWYAAYFLMAIPSGFVARKFGYRGGILSGLIIVVIGSVLFVPVTKISGSPNLIFAAFLGALFLVGAGLTFLETVANPYTTVLGPVDSAVSRINLAQSCNAVGWILGPIIGGTFILSKTENVNTSNEALYIPYLIVAAVVAVLVIIFSLAPVPDLKATEEMQQADDTSRADKPLYKEWHFILAWLSQFLYVAAQTGIFSYFINYIKDDNYMPNLPVWLAGLLPSAMKYLQTGTTDIWRMTEYGAGMLLSVAFVFFTIGRFSGSVIVKFFRPHIVLGLYGLLNALMMILVYLGVGWVSVIALIMSFFFMSIMYPTHFALAIRGLGENTKFASSCMVTAIIGGSLMPYFMGRLAEKHGMGFGFLMPMICFAFIAWYGFSWRRLFTRDMNPT